MHKRFGGVHAVDGLDLRVERGTVHALIGPNGSGKTTLLNVLSGIYRPTAGRLSLDGVEFGRRAPHQRAALGLGRTFQNIRLFPALSALENVMVGAQRRHNPIAPGDAALRAHALAALDFVGLADRADDAVHRLPYGHQRLVEIARALAGSPRLLLLDEPAAGLNPSEKQRAASRLLDRLRARGLTLLLDRPRRAARRAGWRTRSRYSTSAARSPRARRRRCCGDPEVVAAYLGEPHVAPAA